jgi:hypothetical protein
VLEAGQKKKALERLLTMMRKGFLRFPSCLRLMQIERWQTLKG